MGGATSRRGRHLIVLLHRWLALVLGGWFVLAGLTGVALLWRDEIDRLLNPALLEGATAGPRMPPERLPALVQARYPGAMPEVIRMPGTDRAAYRVLLRTDGGRRIGARRVEASFDAVGGQWLGERDPLERSLRPPALMATVHDLHHRLLLGNAGKDVVAVAGLAMVVTILAGLVLAVPRWRWASLRRALGLKLSAGTKRQIYDAHRSAGLVCGGLLLVSAATGVAMAWPEYARDLVGAASPVRALPVVPWRPLARAPLAPTERGPDLARIVERSLAHRPGASITEIHLGGSRDAPVLVYLHAAGDAHRLGDVRTLHRAAGGDLLLAVEPGSRTRGEGLLHWIVPLHAGTWLQGLGRPMMALAGLLPAWMLATGLLVWRHKRAARRGLRAGAPGARVARATGL
ncbi:MAG: PepSY-associated TM helix domain-containing protein [Lautropia sp.]